VQALVEARQITGYFQSIYREEMRFLRKTLDFAVFRYRSQHERHSNHARQNALEIEGENRARCAFELSKFERVVATSCG
jgi:hypothetical protein